MTQNDKQLLLITLCGMLPYGVKYQDRIDGGIHILSLGIIHHYDRFIPYLRPISSMTEEEKKEFQACHCVYELHPDFQPMMCNLANELNMFDWLNAHHFDYRGLIEKGLALEAPEGMYKIS